MEKFKNAKIIFQGYDKVYIKSFTSEVRAQVFAKKILNSEVKPVGTGFAVYGVKLPR